MEDRTHTPGLMQGAIRYDGLYNIRDESCELVAEGLTESNAKEIVRRFNAFSELLDLILSYATKDYRGRNLEQTLEAIAELARGVKS